MGKRGVQSVASKSTKARPKSKAKRLPWDRKTYSRAEKVIAFLEFLPITSGMLAGQKLKLQDWQKDIIRAIYDTDKDGRRKVRTALITLPRKNGKTALAAGLALCALFGPEVEQRGQIFSAAADRDQAALIFSEMEAAILAVPEFSERAHIQSFKKTISDTISGTVYKAVTSDSRKAHGLSPSFIIYDELAQAPNRELYDNLITGTGARKEPLMIVISTQSPDPHHVMSELVDYALKIEEGTLPADPAFHGTIYKAPEDADPWAESTWYACNPALGTFRSLEEMQIFAEQAKKIPAKEAVFRGLYLNQRVDSSAKWISTIAFDECVGAIPDLSGRECYAGLDLSNVHDLSALSLVFLPITEEEPFFTLHYAWCPGDGIKTRAKNDRVPYDLWRDDEHLEATPGAVIDYAYILKRIEAISKTYDLKAILFDRWGSTHIIKELEDAGHTVLEMGQGFASMSAPSKELEKLVLSKKIVFPDNPALRWCFSNVIAEADAAGNLKPSKRKSKEKIDMVVALIMALDGALRNTKKTFQPVIAWL